MEEIENVSSLIEQRAHKNAEGFDHSELCYNSIFHLLNDNGVFIQVIHEMTHDEVDDEDVELHTFKHGYIKEKDGKVYPKVDLIISVTCCNVKCANYCLTLTPFSAYMESMNWDDIVWINCEKKLTKIWRTIMKGIFKDKWIVACQTYLAEVKNLKDSKIATQAEFEYLKNEQEFNEDINSIL